MLGTGQIARGAIIGQKGGVWATSAGYTVRNRPIHLFRDQPLS